MNSSEGFPINGIQQENSSSGSQNSTSDSNANLDNSHRSKGAIPKVKSVKPHNSSKKSKLNNNVDEIVTSKRSSNLTDDVLQLHSDALRINGFSDHLSRISGSYLDDSKSVLYGSNSDICENCSGVNKTNGVLCENQFNSDIFTSKLDENGYSTKATCKNSSYQEDSTKDFQLDFRLKLDTESNSSDDTELLSISDDGCIYTYKGDNVADLPSSFFSLDIPFTQSSSPQNRQNNISPEMDFLEMDFDPGPSGDADSDSQSINMDSTENLPQDLLQRIEEASNSKFHANQNLDVNASTSTILQENDSQDKATSSNTTQAKVPELLSLPTSSTLIPDETSELNTTENLSLNIIEKMQKLSMPWSCYLAQRTTSNCNNRIRYNHCSEDNLMLLLEKPHVSKKNTNVAIKNIEDEDNKVMIWSDLEATQKQTTQIGASGGGVTAVINVLKALHLPIPSIDKVQEAVTTRLYSNSSSLTEYLLSRSVAGTAHIDLINGLNTISEGQIYARFFHMYPERVVNLYSWLKFWISHGAVPVATLNLQKILGIPNSWHHQVIYGISQNMVYLTNPLEKVDVEFFWQQLLSESVLLIPKEDVLSRWNIKSDLDQLMKVKDKHWHKINVVGQVASLVRENMREKRLGFVNTTHIKIPTVYSAGITLVIKTDSPMCSFLMCCPELPLLPQTEEAAGQWNVLY